MYIFCPKQMLNARLTFIRYSYGVSCAFDISLTNNTLAQVVSGTAIPQANAAELLELLSVLAFSGGRL